MARHVDRIGKLMEVSSWLSLAGKIAFEFGGYRSGQIDVVLFLETASLDRIGIVAKPSLVVLDAPPLQKLSRQFNLLLAARKNIPVDDFVEISVREMVGEAKHNFL